MSKAPTLAILVLVGCGRIDFQPLPIAGDAADARGTDSNGPPPRSCEGGLANTCGPFATGSCCETPFVPGGTYARSYDLIGDGMYGDSSFPATVSDFRLDKYEVTVGRFREFIAAGQGTQASPPSPGAGAHPNIANSGWDSAWNTNLEADTAALIAALNCNMTKQSWTDAPGSNENLPLNCVTWFEMAAFCAWDGGFMPTEAEWNYAASGGDEQRAYPWSSPPTALDIDCTYANYNSGTGFCVGTSGLVNVVGSESPRGDGRWGHSDLSGNGWEWVFDWSATQYPLPCSDCADLTTATHRSVRGGGFGNIETSLRTGIRGNSLPHFRLDFIVGRCARAP